MRTQLRRRRLRGAGVLLATLTLLVAVVTLTSRGDAPGQMARAATATVDDPGGRARPHDALDLRTAPIYRGLRRERATAGLPPLRPHDGLMAASARDACAVARGEIPLSGDADRLAAAGADSENVGMVIDQDARAGARAMRDWWSRTHVHRSTRMDRTLTRYGIGACNAGDRTYYVERFAR